MSGSRRKPGPLGPFVDGYRRWLLERGYSQSVAIRSLITLGHLGRWMEREELAVDQLTDERVTAFLAEYRSDRGHRPSSSVWPLLEYLRADDVVPPEPSGVVTPLECLVGDYRDWLLRERGLALITVRASERLARRFLTERVSFDDPCGAERITGGEFNGFLLRECARVSVGSAACCTYRLRSLLRYLAVRGLADPGLAEAVPRVARLGCARWKCRAYSSTISTGVPATSPSTARPIDATYYRSPAMSARRSSPISSIAEASAARRAPTPPGRLLRAAAPRPRG
jgi:hypothetical protein